MKSILLVALLFAVCQHGSAASINRYHSPRSDGNMNEYFDSLVTQLREFFKNNSLDPMVLPNVGQSFSFKDLLGVTWHGELELQEISVSGLSQLTRSGDATLGYNNKKLEIQVELGFDDIQLDSVFVAQIMNIGPKGNVEGSIQNLKIYIDIDADMATFDISLKDLKITDAGKIDVQVHGQGLLDLLVDAITDTVNTILHDVVVQVIAQEVRSVVEKALDEIDIDCLITGGSNCKGTLKQLPM
ncbi:mite allergen Der p 7 [Anabrus simplex]|uniref:mite allergen Der p 7 n=1 Tax=Anabrus simplex TaxID=316456 RepID=UPI0034DD766D